MLFLHPEARCLAWVFLELSFNVHISKMDVQTWWQLGWPWRVIDNFKADYYFQKVIFEAEQIWGPAVWSATQEWGWREQCAQLSSGPSLPLAAHNCNPVRKHTKNTKIQKIQNIKKIQNSGGGVSRVLSPHHWALFLFLSPSLFLLTTATHLGTMCK